jgi:hypothetical protein
MTTLGKLCLCLFYSLRTFLQPLPLAFFFNFIETDTFLLVMISARVQSVEQTLLCPQSVLDTLDYSNCFK